MSKRLEERPLVGLVNRVPSNRRLNFPDLLVNKDAQALKRDLRRLQHASDADIVLVFKKARGGSFDAGMMFCEMVQSSKARIIGLVKNKAHSAAFMVFEHCKIRVAKPSATLRIHYASWRDSSPPIVNHDTDKAAYLEEVAQRFDVNQEIIREEREGTIQTLLKRCTLKEPQLRELLQQARPMDVMEAMKYGFLDGIV